MSIQQLERPETAQVRDEWIRSVQQLEQDLTDWSTTAGWQVTKSERVVNEESIGTYAVPDLVIETPAGERLVVEVKGRGPAAASGRVQLFAWPTLFRVLLLHKPGKDDWTVRTESGIPLRQPWNRDTFITLAEDLLSADE